MAYIPAFPTIVLAVQAKGGTIPAPRPIDLQPPQGDATPQTHAWASLTG